MLVLSTLVWLASCQSTRINGLGIGIGTLIIIIALILSLFWCMLCRTSSRPQLYSLLGLLLPLILILLFIFIPKESQRPTSPSATDYNFVSHVVFLILAIIGFVFVMVVLALTEGFKSKKARNVARSAFVLKEEGPLVRAEEESIQGTDPSFH